MNASFYDQLVATAARRSLTAAEETQLRAWLTAHPEFRGLWQEEAELDKLLRRLPDAPLSTNFTAQVLQAAERASVPCHRPRHGLGAWWRRVGSWRYGWQAAAVVVVGAAALGVHFERVSTREELARSFVALPAAGLADVELWQNFDSIRSLPDGALPSAEELAEAVK